MFSCEFCGISKNTFSYRTPLVAASEHSLRMFLINKKIVFTEKRHRVKFSSIKKHLLLIKQKEKKSKIPKCIWMKPCSKTRSGKSGCANIFLELSLTIQFRHYLGMNEHHAIDHTFTFMQLLLIYLLTLKILTQPSEQNS